MLLYIFLCTEKSADGALVLQEKLLSSLELMFTLAQLSSSQLHTHTHREYLSYTLISFHLNPRSLQKQQNWHCTYTHTHWRFHNIWAFHYWRKKHSAVIRVIVAVVGKAKALIEYLRILCVLLFTHLQLFVNLNQLSVHLLNRHHTPQLIYLAEPWRLRLKRTGSAR